MLLRTLFLLALIAVLAETIVHGAGALARVALREREAGAERAAFGAAIAAAQHTIAEAVAAGTSPASAVPTPFASCYAATSAGCAISVLVSVAASTPEPSPSGCPQTDCTVFFQQNTTVAESRAAYRVTTTVTAANGDTLDTRTSDIAFRTFTVPPYASLVGSLDTTLDAIVNGGTGDDGGSNDGAGTLITVEYQPSDAALPATAGNVWHAADENPATNVPAWDR